MKSLFVLLALVVGSLAVKDKRYGVPQPRKDGTIKRQASSSCGDIQYQCHRFAQCIQEEWVCDMERDCYDGSDEENCPTDCSGDHQFPCHGEKCISIEYRCDGTNDCGDNSDEINCRQVECPAGEIKCDTFLCIEETWLCDGRNDCRDNWDEKNCTSSCLSSQFRCNDGSRCIDRRWMCDGDDDCVDKSDETGCVCQQNEFKCHSGKCIAESWQCDGDNDCGDFSDETHCGTIHPSLCGDMLTARDCALMNETVDPICLKSEDGFKFCRKFCDLCPHT